MAELAERQPGQGLSNIDEGKRQKLLELVRGRAMARPTDLAEDEVMVWPSLVVVEAVSAVVFLIILTALSVLVSAPLTRHADPNVTPNPSKAPWYFLNLQELLLHMDPGLAGVILPTVALVAIAAIPYLDRSPLGVGILGTSSKGRKIIGFTAVFTAVVLTAMIWFDQPAGTQFGIGPWLKSNFGASELVYAQILPTLIILAGIVVLLGLVHRIFRPTRRETIIALFTAFYVTYIVLTVVGTSFRGHGQELTVPWHLPTEHPGAE